MTNCSRFANARSRVESGEWRVESGFAVTHNYDRRTDDGRELRSIANWVRFAIALEWRVESGFAVSHNYDRRAGGGRELRSMANYGRYRSRVESEL